jgi:hypothetical protein
MGDVPPILDYKVVLTKDKFNGLREHYNIRTDPDLGVGWAALRWVACGCGPCKDQLERPWVPLVEPAMQPRHAQNKECILWPSYEGANDWKLHPCSQNRGGQEGGTEVNQFCPQRVRGAHVTHRERGKVGAVGTTNEAAAGYYLVKWLSEPIQRACPGLFPLGKWWSMRCTSTRHIAHKTGTHTVSHYDGLGGKTYLADWLVSAANQRDKCAPTRVRKSRSNVEEGREGIVSGPRGDHGGDKQMQQAGVQG